MSEGAGDGSGRVTGLAPGALTALLAEVAAAPEKQEGEEAPLAPGTPVGRFEIIRELGRGGFGTVYEAFDPELGRSVALKALRSHATSQQLSSDWIKKEAEAVARLNHPAIVTLHDVGTGPAGPYLVMELLQGETLAHRIEQGPLPVDEALRLADEMAQGLAHAHANGVLHRDLKPANAFVCQDGRVKILDFGLAHLLGTELGSSGGTPAYMAPEQARGAVVDERADVYALGTILFQLLTGNLPFEAGAERGCTEGDDPLPVPGAPTVVLKLLGRMLARDPAGRPASGEEVRSALASIRKARERRRAARVAWSLAACATLIAAAAAFWPRPPPLPPGRLTLAMADTANASGDATLEGAAGLLRQALEQSPRVSILPRAQLARALEGKGDAPGSAIDEAAALRAARSTKAHVTIGLTVRPSGTGLELEARGTDVEHDRPLFTLREYTGGPAGVPDALDRLSDRIRAGLREEPGSAGPPVRLAQFVSPKPEAWAAYIEGKKLELEGRTQASLERYRKAVEMDPEFPLPHIGLAVAEEYTSRDLVERHLEVALRHPERVPPKERRLAEATAALITWDFARALERYDQVIAGWPDDPDAYGGAVELIADRLADWGSARPYLEKFLALGNLPPVKEIEALDRLGRHDEALARARRFAAEEPGRLSSTWLSWVHRIRGEPALALEAARAALAFEGGPPSDELFWSFVEGDALPELEGIVADVPLYRFRLLALHGRWREALAAFDARRRPGPPSDAFHMVRSDMIFGSGDAEALRGEVDALFWLGNGTIICYAGALAELGDLDRAARLQGLWPMLDARIPCNRLHKVARMWRLGDLEGALRIARNVHFATLSYLRGRIQLDAGRPAEAIKEFQRYRRNPNYVDGTILGLYVYPRSLYFEAVALERIGDPEGAVATLDRLLRLWSRADEDIPEYRAAKTMRAKLASLTR